MQVGIDLRGVSELDAVSDAISLGQTTGIDETLGQFPFVGCEAQAEIDAGVRCRLDLGEDVVAVQRKP